MQVTLVHVYVKSTDINDFIIACEKNHKASIKESGNFRFDILQQEDESTHFVLYESYKTLDDAMAHKNTQHYLEWRECVASMMEKPRTGIAFKGLYP